jgi:dienelactone hydrolase
VYTQGEPRRRSQDARIAEADHAAAAAGLSGIEVPPETGDIASLEDEPQIAAASRGGEDAMVDEAVRIPIGGGESVQADLRVPPDARGLVVFAHGSGSSRLSPRNRAVAEALHSRSLGTLLLDLLTQPEEAIDLRTAEYRFDIDLLGDRVVAATDWLQDRDDVGTLPLGYFGASTGAAAALRAAAARPDVVRAIVSRGGRPDLAGDALSRVTAPTLLIVGGRDEPVIELNEQAKAKMTSAHVELRIVPGATHLFEEPGALEQVAQLAGDWFERFLGRR